MKKILLAVGLFCTLASHATENPAGEMKKTETCAGCHGPQGVSTNPEWPNLAGQHASYTIKQLQDYKKGEARSAPLMTAIAASLSDSDLNELATFYAQQPPAESYASQEYVKRGEELYRGGDFKKHITACIACHGPKGSGNAEAGFPLLSGQHAAYTLQTLLAFKEHKRKNDLNAIMRDITAKMDEEDMKAVASYIEGLH